MRGPVVARAHFRFGCTTGLFQALFFIPINTEKPAQLSQAGGKGIRSRMAAIATLGCGGMMADQDADEVFSLIASSVVKSFFRAMSSSWELSTALIMLTGRPAADF